MSIRTTYKDCKGGYTVGNTLKYGTDAHYLGEDETIEDYNDFDGVIIPYKVCEIKGWRIQNKNMETKVVW